MDNQNNKKTINVDEMLNRKRARNEQAKLITKANIKKRNEQIANQHKTNIEDNLLGEASIDLENQLLEAEYEGTKSFNNNYIESTNRVINRINAQADMEAQVINSAEDEALDVEFQIIEELPYLAPRQSRFSAGFLLASSETEEVVNPLLPPSQPSKPSKFNKEFL